MNYPELAAASQICHRFNLGEPPTLQRVQRLFYDLYVCAQLDPGYLFVAPREYEGLNDEFHKEMAALWQAPADAPRAHGEIQQILNETTGHRVHLVPLPGMEYGGVIVGFFR